MTPTPTAMPTYAQLKSWLRDTREGDEAAQFRERQLKLYGPNNLGTGLSRVQGVKLNKAIGAGKRAEAELIACGYFDAAGCYVNSTNPVYRSAAKWFEKTYC